MHLVTLFLLRRIYLHARTSHGNVSVRLLEVLKEGCYTEKVCISY